MTKQLIIAMIFVALCTISLHININYEAQQTRDLINKEIPKQIQTNVVELSNQIACQLGEKAYCNEFLLEF